MSLDLKLSKSFDREIALVGEERFLRLSSARVLVVGLGGVGGAAAEALVRYGVGSLTFVDGDVFEESNLNRQLLCTAADIGKNKADVAAARAVAVVPGVKAVAMPCFFTRDNADGILSGGYDYCVDAIDDLDNKVALIAECKRRAIPVVSAMGAGNRLDCRFAVTDIYATANDPLARVMRKKLRAIGVTELPVVCAAAPALRPDGVPTSAQMPSCAAPPMVMGAMLAAFVANSVMGI